jgi:hypothetical protein
VWTKVQLSNVEAVGAGTLAWDQTAERVAPHIHLAVGLKEHSATGHTSHLLAATVQFLTEIGAEPAEESAAHASHTSARSQPHGDGRRSTGYARQPNLSPGLMPRR